MPEDSTSLPAKRLTLPFSYLFRMAFPIGMKSGSLAAVPASFVRSALVRSSSIFWYYPVLNAPLVLCETAASISSIAFYLYPLPTKHLVA